MDHSFLEKLEEYKSFFSIFYYLIFQEQKVMILNQLKIMDKINYEILKRNITIESKYEALKQAQKTRNILETYLLFLEKAFRFSVRKTQKLALP